MYVAPYTRPCTYGAMRGARGVTPTSKLYSYKYFYNFPSLLGYFFFSLPTQEFFRGQGKIKVGTETEIMHLISRKLQLDEEALFYNLTMRIIDT